MDDKNEDMMMADMTKTSPQRTPLSFSNFAEDPGRCLEVFGRILLFEPWIQIIEHKFYENSIIYKFI